MRIAVVFSGLIRGNYEENIALFRQKLPTAHFWFTTWKGQQELDYMHRYYDEPIVDYKPATDLEYPHTYKRFLSRPNDPYADAPQNWQHRSKQILAHCMAVEDFCSDYDVIVRARYDCKLCDYLNLYEFCDITYKENKSIGFFTPRHMSQTPTSLTSVTSGNRHYQHHVDHLIVHKKSLLHTDIAFKLHNDKKLLVAEYGWWQVLSEPNGDNHLAYRGGVKLD